MTALPARPRCVDEPDRIARDLLGDDDLPHQLLDLENLGTAQHTFRRMRRHARRFSDNADLFIFGEVGHDDVEHEAIELRFWQWG